MSIANVDQEAEIEFISGVDASGLVSAHSFANWNDDTPATYGASSGEAKWGLDSAKTGATVTFSFEPSSNWTTTEQAGFKAAMELWSAVTNIHFVAASSTGSAQLVITRSSDNSAEELTSRFYPGYENSSHLGTLLKTSISIDPSVYGFGPIGTSVATAGGYPWMTIEHELGHAIGLGHAGAYNDDAGSKQASYPAFNGFDTRSWSIMSYQNPIGHDGDQVPVTPMVLDVAAVQRLYGVATESPLAGGGQIFGFHSNITGDLGQFFDFTQNHSPFVTIWDGGNNNSLDLSGFSAPARVSLQDGSLNDVGGLTQNLGISFGTHIETLIGGSGNDRFIGNALNDVIQGGAGADTIVAGDGNNHLYGNMISGQQGAVDGNDVITAGAGTNYINGNGGDDQISAGADGSTGSNRLFGGQGNDQITICGAGHNSANGNLGNDTIDASAATGDNQLRGGQGNDLIRAGRGHDQLMGDLGADTLVAGTGTGHITLMTGGSDGSSDLFVFHGTQASAVVNGQVFYQEVNDYVQGTDHLAFDYQPVSVHTDSANFSDVSSAESMAQAWLNRQHGGLVVAEQVGEDSYTFYNASGLNTAIDSVVKLDHTAAASFGVGDFIKAPV